MLGFLCYFGCLLLSSPIHGMVLSYPVASLVTNRTFRNACVALTAEAEHLLAPNATSTVPLSGLNRSRANIAPSNLLLLLVGHNDLAFLGAPDL